MDVVCVDDSLTSKKKETKKSPSKKTRSQTPTRKQKKSIESQKIETNHCSATSLDFDNFKSQNSNIKQSGAENLSPLHSLHTELAKRMDLDHHVSPMDMTSSLGKPYISSGLKVNRTPSNSDHSEKPKHAVQFDSHFISRVSQSKSSTHKASSKPTTPKNSDTPKRHELSRSTLGTNPAKSSRMLQLKQEAKVPVGRHHSGPITQGEVVHAESIRCEHLEDTMSIMFRQYNNAIKEYKDLVSDAIAQGKVTRSGLTFQKCCEIIDDEKGIEGNFILEKVTLYKHFKRTSIKDDDDFAIRASKVDPDFAALI